ncbi:hypothetical protein ACXR6G_07320 [Ancylomarina sp. YFZ004]
MKNTKIKYIIIALIFVVVYVVITELIFKNRRQLFYESNLQGKLIEIYSSRDGIKISINSNDKSYRFYPIKSFDTSKSFENVAQIGDSIIKPTKSDTLKLIKKGKVYLYTFRKSD